MMLVQILNTFAVYSMHLILLMTAKQPVDWRQVDHQISVVSVARTERYTLHQTELDDAVTN